MLDDMFSFIDPIFDAAEDGFQLFVTQMDAFLDELETKKQLPPRLQKPLSEEDYKQMWMLRYQQHLGNISFLELVGKYEQMLGISVPQDGSGT